ncbi:CbiX/SirB N-terminal domain-containing protein [Peptococcaceae bacterium 1198_IL3148]
MIKEGVLILAHGSRREAGNEEVKNITKQIKAKDGLNRLYQAAFMEFGQPNMVDGVAKLIDSGVQKVIVVPLFLFSGNHIWRDIPQALEQQRQQYPNVQFVLARHIAAANLFPDLVAELIDGVDNK